MEDFVTIEIAKKLKEKGYNGRTDGRHVEKVPGTEREEWDDAEAMYVTVTNVVTTPRVRIWDALKWLREEKYVFIAINISWCFEDEEHPFYEVKEPIFKGYYSSVHFLKDLAKQNTFKSENYNTYESAALAGIEYVLDNLI